MADINGGLHPAVDGQSLDEDEVWIAYRWQIFVKHVWTDDRWKIFVKHVWVADRWKILMKHVCG